MQLPPLLTQIFHDNFACSYQIPYGFMSRIWHPDRRALESAGVEFIDENGGGPGVRLWKRQPKKG